MGSGLCVVYAPDSFEIDDEARSSVKDAGASTLEQLRAAAEACPTGAIRLIEATQP